MIKNDQKSFETHSSKSSKYYIALFSTPQNGTFYITILLTNSALDATFNMSNYNTPTPLSPRTRFNILSFSPVEISENFRNVVCMYRSRGHQPFEMVCHAIATPGAGGRAVEEIHM